MNVNLNSMILTKIQFHHKNFKLDQYQPNDKLASFHFNEIELEDECDTDSQYCDSVPLFESMLTPVSLPDSDLILKPTLIPIPIELEHEPLILDSHIPLLGNECQLNSMIWTKPMTNSDSRTQT